MTTSLPVRSVQSRAPLPAFPASKVLHPKIPAPRLCDRGPDLTAFPDEYALMIDGTCMEPALPNHSKAIFSKSAAWAAGDVIAIWLRPEAVQPGSHEAIVKCLVSAPPRLRGRELLIVESINPQQRFAIRCEDIIGIHKLVAVVR